jgi:hypothetical protein
MTARRLTAPVSYGTPAWTGCDRHRRTTRSSVSAFETESRYVRRSGRRLPHQKTRRETHYRRDRRQGREPERRGNSARFCGQGASAWRWWEESCKPAAKTTRRTVSRGGSTIERTKSRPERQPAFLDKVVVGIRLEARITGTEAPVQQQIENRVTLEDRVVGPRSTPTTERIDGNSK